MITEELTKPVRVFLEIPDSHLTPMADGGGHGAQLMAWMNLLRPPAAETPQKVVVLDFGAFGTRWAGDLQEMHDKGQIDLEVRKVSEGDFPSMVGIDLSADIVFCGNETSAGVGIKEDALADFVTKREAAQREAGITGVNAGKIIMDATSAAGCMHIPDSVAYSLPAQKVIGGNSTTAWLVIPEEFTDRIELEKPWAIPSLFSLHKRNPETGEKTPDHGIRSGNVLIRSVLTRDIYETLICVDELNRLGGLDASIARCEAGSRHFQEALAAHSYGLEKIVATPSIQGNFNCVIKCTHPYYQALSGAEQKEVLKRTHEILEKEEREFDIKAFPGGDGAFRVTTIHVANPDEAKNLVDNIQYGLNRAMCEMLEEKLAVETERVAETGRSMLMHVMTDTSPRGLALQEAIAIQAERDAEGFAARQAARQAESRSYHRA
jgi:phosphoserine aminotransferase